MANEKWLEIIDYMENHQDEIPAFKDVLICVGTLDNLSPNENPRRISTRDILKNCGAVDENGLDTYLHLLETKECITVHEDQYGRYVVITKDGQGVSMVAQIGDRLRERWKR